MQFTDEQLKIITATASQAAIEAYREHSKNEQEARRDRRLRNIILLLKNYRSFVKHCEDMENEIVDLDKEVEIAILDSEVFAIEAIKRSKKRTLAFVRFVKKMIGVFEKMCQEEGPEAERRFKVISALYISDTKKTFREISNDLFLSEKTVKRDRDRAVETLSVLMFGIDAIKLG